jgi:hypothetical protein
MRKELRPIHEDVSCDVCGRSILKGERPETYLATGGQRHVVCELCTDRAYAEGWIRESAHDELPATGRRPEQRPSILSRFRRGKREPDPLAEPYAAMAAEEAPAYADEPVAEAWPQPGPEPQPEPEAADPPPAPPPSRPKDPRHVRAVPTNAQVKVERALEVFNTSEHVRTIGGITRTLGEPWVSAGPLAEAPSEVSLVVAWELSWYQYRVDLGDANDPVTLVAKGQELDELDESMREWNATALADGRLAVGVSTQ